MRRPSVPCGSPSLSSSLLSITTVNLAGGGNSDRSTRKAMPSTFEWCCVSSGVVSSSATEVIVDLVV